MKRFHKKNKAPKAPVSPEQKAQKRKRLRRVSVSAAGLAFALAAVILLNLVCTNLTDRFDLTLDLTANQLYEITDDTIVNIHAEAYLYGEGETFKATLARIEEINEAYIQPLVKIKEEE